MNLGNIGDHEIDKLKLEEEIQSVRELERQLMAAKARVHELQERLQKQPSQTSKYHTITHSEAKCQTSPVEAPLPSSSNAISPPIASQGDPTTKVSEHTSQRFGDATMFTPNEIPSYASFTIGWDAKSKHRAEILCTSSDIYDEVISQSLLIAPLNIEERLKQEIGGRRHSDGEISASTQPDDVSTGSSASDCQPCASLTASASASASSNSSFSSTSELPGAVQTFPLPEAHKSGCSESSCTSSNSRKIQTTLEISKHSSRECNASMERSHTIPVHNNGEPKIDFSSNVRLHFHLPKRGHSEIQRKASVGIPGRVKASLPTVISHPSASVSTKSPITGYIVVPDVLAISSFGSRRLSVSELFQGEERQQSSEPLIETHSAPNGTCGISRSPTSGGMSSTSKSVFQPGGHISPKHSDFKSNKPNSVEEVAQTLVSLISEAYSTHHDRTFATLSGESECSMRYTTVLQEFLGQAAVALSEEPTLLEISSPVFVMGDLQGSYPDLDYFLHSILSFNSPSCTPSRMLWLGSYIGALESSIEVMVVLLAYKVLAPTSIFLLRGRKELSDCSSFFVNICQRRFGAQTGKLLYQSFLQVFAQLPLCAIIDNSLFCAHGGVPTLVLPKERYQDCLELLRLRTFPKLESWVDPLGNAVFGSAETSRMILRQRSLVYDLLWSALTPSLDGDHSGHIHIVDEFGWDPVTADAHLLDCKTLDSFLRDTKLQCALLCERQPSAFGIQLRNQGKLLTLFSSSSAATSSWGQAGAAFIANGKIQLVSILSHETPPSTQVSATSSMPVITLGTHTQADNTKEVHLNLRRKFKIDQQTSPLQPAPSPTSLALESLGFSSPSLTGLSSCPPVLSVTTPLARSTVTLLKENPPVAVQDRLALPPSFSESALVTPTKSQLGSGGNATTGGNASATTATTPTTFKFRIPSPSAGQKAGASTFNFRHGSGETGAKRASVNVPVTQESYALNI